MPFYVFKLHFNYNITFPYLPLDDKWCSSSNNNKEYSNPYQSLTNINDFCDCKIRCQQDSNCAAFDFSWKGGYGGSWTCNLIASQTSLKNNNFGNAGTKYCQTTGTLVPVVKTAGKQKKMCMALCRCCMMKGNKDFILQRFI